MRYLIVAKNIVLVRDFASIKQARDWTKSYVGSTGVTVQRTKRVDIVTGETTLVLN